MEDIKLMVLKKVDGRSNRATPVRPRHRQLYLELQKPEHKGLITSAMRALDFTPSLIDSPTQVTRTKSWKALLDERLSEDLLTRRHTELLNKRDGTYVTIGRGKSRRVEFIDKGPDTTAVARGLELAYKLRGSFVPEPVAVAPANVYNLFYSPQVRASVASFEAQLKHAIAHEITSTPSTPILEAGSTADTGSSTAGDHTGDTPTPSE